MRQAVLLAGERELETESSHDFTKIGRVAYSIERRTKLLEKVQVLSESLGISGKAQRGADGSPSYTCESAAYFYKHQLLRRRKVFESNLAKLALGHLCQHCRLSLSSFEINGLSVTHKIPGPSERSVCSRTCFW